MSIVSTIVLISSVAFADSAEAEQAEMERILEDMKQFREQANWTIVDKKYGQLLDFSKGDPTYDMHVLGAEAASNLGNVSEVSSRLQKALAIEEIPKTRQWLDSINQSYSPVTIRIPKKIESSPDLLIGMMPFFPDQQLAFAFAQEQLKATGKFQGYLPFGDYSIGDSSFNLSKGGTGEVVVVRTGGTPKNKPSPSSSDSIVAYRMDVGISAANAGQSSSNGQALPFGGAGTRVGVGASYPISDMISVVGQIGYHGLFSAGESPSVSGISMVGYDVTPTVYHGVYTWLAGSMSLSQLEVLLGPTLEFANVQTQGLVLSDSQMEYTSGQGDYLSVQGALLASGLSAGVTYAAFEMGDGMQGGLSTFVGTQSDGSRWYSWGQVSFTLKSL
jgi:hypothetical protein